MRVRASFLWIKLAQNETFLRMESGLHFMRKTSLIVSLLFVCGGALAQDVPTDTPENWAKRVRPLAAVDEERWINTFKAYKTADGSTILQVLQFVEKLRPKAFKFFFGEESIGYAYVTGLPISVGVNYYLGIKRQPSDHYGIGADVKIEGSDAITLAFQEVPGSGNEALLSGRDAFLRYIDQHYSEVCIDAETKRRLC